MKDDQSALMAADGSRRRRLPVGPVLNSSRLSLAPNGRDLAFNRRAESGDVNAVPDIWRATVRGSEQRRLGTGWTPRWSPDGHRIAFGDTHGGVSVMSARTGRLIRRVIRSTRGPGWLDWSPDGRRILWSVGGDLLIARADRTAPVKHIDAPSVAAVWSPDGRRIAFVSLQIPDFAGGAAVRYSIWTMSPRGDRRKRIASTGVLINEQISGDPMLAWGSRPR